MKFRNPFKGLTKFEWGLWLCSMIVVLITGVLGGTSSILSLIASLVGVTSLIFAARGDVFGPILMVVFAVLYGIVSYTFRYYGEIITYLGMSAPISLMAVYSWLKNPHKQGEVKIADMSKKQCAIMLLVTAGVTTAFYFILDALHTPNMVFSTISIATSFLAAYLTVLRHPAYALSYAANDVVLIILWVLASFDDPSYLTMVVCFTVFLINDLYGFINWRKMKKRQNG